MPVRSVARASVSEMKEFATFAAGTQRYIRRSIDVAEGAGDVLHWARDGAEAESIRQQVRIYGRLAEVRDSVPVTSDLMDVEPLMSPLIVMAGFDLGQGRLPTFGSFRFLYERLIGGRCRPWLPSVFLAASALPSMAPSLRGTLLKSISEQVAMASGWASYDSVFIPSYVEKVEA